MDIKGSKTEKNLYRTFAGESRATVKYYIYSEEADKEGNKCIAQVFKETAENEKAHAREVFKRYLKQVGSISENLMDAINSEDRESKNIYRRYENDAREEGFEEIEKFYRELREVEESHKIRFEKLDRKSVV